MAFIEMLLLDQQLWHACISDQVQQQQQQQHTPNQHPHLNANAATL
jgi:hypothetical protein